MHVHLSPQFLERVAAPFLANPEHIEVIPAFAARAAQATAHERLRVTLNQYQAKATLLKDVLQVQDAGSAARTAQSELRKALGEE